MYMQVRKRWYMYTSRYLNRWLIDIQWDFILLLYISLLFSIYIHVSTVIDQFSVGPFIMSWRVSNDVYLPTCKGWGTAAKKQRKPGPSCFWANLRSRSISPLSSPGARWWHPAQTRNKRDELQRHSVTRFSCLQHLYVCEILIQDTLCPLGFWAKRHSTRRAVK